MEPVVWNIEYDNQQRAYEYVFMSLGNFYAGANILWQSARKIVKWEVESVTPCLRIKSKAMREIWAYEDGTRIGKCILVCSFLDLISLPEAIPHFLNDPNQHWGVCFMVVLIVLRYLFSFLFYNHDVTLLGTVLFSCAFWLGRNIFL